MTTDAIDGVKRQLTSVNGQIKALVCIAGNPVLSTPNGRQLEQALQQLDFMVSLDVYLNETSQYADVILPAATIGRHATIGPVSLVMRGESVPDKTRWIGNPIAPWPATQPTTEE